MSTQSEQERQQLQQEYKKYQSYLDSQLRIDQQKYEEKIANLKQKQEDYNQVLQYMHIQIQSQKQQSDNTKPQKMSMDIGSQFYMQSKLLKNDVIVLDVGLDVFVELQFNEAVPIVKQRIQILQQNIDKFQINLAHIKANVKAFEATLNKIESLQQK